MLGVRGALMPWLSIRGECAPQGAFGNVFETFGVVTIGGLGTSESWWVETSMLPNTLPVHRRAPARGVSAVPRWETPLSDVMTGEHTVAWHPTVVRRRHENSL